MLHDKRGDHYSERNSFLSNNDTQREIEKTVIEEKEIIIFQFW